MHQLQQQHTQTVEPISYYLPKDLIAQTAAEPRDQARMMVCKDAAIDHRHFSDLPHFLAPGDVLVINDTRVRKVRLRGKKTTGAPTVAIFMQEIGPSKFLARLTGKHIKPGHRFIFPTHTTQPLETEVVARDDDVLTLQFQSTVTMGDLEQVCEYPAPPYIKRAVGEEYQTIYASDGNSLAAPTAGLHFTDHLLDKIEKMGVIIVRIRLDVGYGTFLPAADLARHQMHEEAFWISTDAATAINNRKGRLFAVGTTVVRALESAARDDGTIAPMAGATKLFITPGHRFKTRLDGMITNFHLPGSTLLQLVCAFFGTERMMTAYEMAVQEKYRFYSLGDAMLLLK